jgi:predicted N-acetyltransferase YhbS
VIAAPTASAFRLRPALAADAGDIARILRAAFAAYDGKLQPRPGALSETAESIAAKLADHRAILAEAEGRPVGSVVYRPEGEGVYMGRLGVLPGWQGRGVGAALVNAVAGRAAAEGARAVTLNVRILLPDNVAFFRRLGFREAGRGTHAGFDRPTFWIMRRELG